MYSILDCPAPKSIDSGAYDKELLKAYSVGQVVTFTCDEERIPEPYGKAIDCTEDGWQINDSPMCLKCEKLYFFNTPHL